MVKPLMTIRKATSVENNWDNRIAKKNNMFDQWPHWPKIVLVQVEKTFRVEDQHQHLEKHLSESGGCGFGLVFFVHVYIK